MKPFKKLAAVPTSVLSFSLARNIYTTAMQYKLNTEPNKNINKQRFANMSTAETDESRTKAETKNTKDSIKWAAQVFERKM